MWINTISVTKTTTTRDSIPQRHTTMNIWSRSPWRFWWRRRLVLIGSPTIKPSTPRGSGFRKSLPFPLHDPARRRDFSNDHPLPFGVGHSPGFVERADEGHRPRPNLVA